MGEKSEPDLLATLNACKHSKMVRVRDVNEQYQVDLIVVDLNAAFFLLNFFLKDPVAITTRDQFRLGSTDCKIKTLYIQLCLFFRFSPQYIHLLFAWGSLVHASYTYFILYRLVSFLPTAGRMFEGAALHVSPINPKSINRSSWGTSSSSFIWFKYLKWTGVDVFRTTEHLVNTYNLFWVLHVHIE